MSVTQSMYSTAKPVSFYKPWSSFVSFYELHCNPMVDLNDLVSSSIWLNWMNVNQFMESLFLSSKYQMLLYLTG